MIRPLPTLQKQQFRTWCVLSIILFAATSMYMIITTIKQIRTIAQLKKEQITLQNFIQNCSDTVAQAEQLQQQNKQLLIQKTRLDRIRNRQITFSLLSTIAQQMPHQTTLSCLVYHKSSLELTGIATDQETILKILTNIQQLAFVKTAKLASLQQIVADQRFNFSIKASLVQ